MEKIVRRWRRKLPHCGGFWLYRISMLDDPEEILISNGATEVDEFDTYAEIKGLKLDCNYTFDCYTDDHCNDCEGNSQWYWEGTTVCEDQFPGYWMQCKDTVKGDWK
jgi:hypothetical protein